MPNGKFYVSDEAVQKLWPEVIKGLSKYPSQKEDMDLNSLMKSPNFMFESADAYKSLWRMISRATGLDYSDNSIVAPRRRLLMTPDEDVRPTL